jgi:hypothetical protein
MDLAMVTHDIGNDIDSNDRIHHMLWVFEHKHGHGFGYIMKFKAGDMETLIESLLELAEKIEAEINPTK